VSLGAALGRARSLSLHDYALLFESVTLAVALELALWLMPFARVREWFRADENPTRSAVTPELHARLSRFAAGAYRLLPLPGTCLRHSLVLCALLGRRGMRGRLCLGVQKHAGTLNAHAWVECEGLPRRSSAEGGTKAGGPVETESAFVELRSHRT
jgi:Transglutaminase-like superfamily